MTALPLLLAVALSAGNAEFERTAVAGAASIAVRRVVAELAEKGPPAGGLEKAMLEGGEKFVSREEAKEACRDIFAAAINEEFDRQLKGICERLGLGEAERAGWRQQAYNNKTGADKLFAAAFEVERKSACERQARGIAGAVKPSEEEVETKDEQALRKEMTAKVVAQQRNAVFEENLKYISETIVDPVIDSAKKEMKRQREYLTRTKCEAYAPSALEKEIEANLRKNVEARKAKEDDPSKVWGVFPKTLADALPAVVEHRTLERVAKNVDDVAVAVDAESILKTIASDPAAHRRADESEKIFRGIFAAQVLDGALARAEQEAPAKTLRKIFSLSAALRCAAGSDAIVFRIASASTSTFTSSTFFATRSSVLFSTAAGSPTSSVFGKTPHAFDGSGSFALRSATFFRRFASISFASADGAYASHFVRVRYSRWRFISFFAESITGSTIASEMYLRFSSKTALFCCAATLFVISARSAFSSLDSNSCSDGFTAPAIPFACFSHALFRSASNAASKSLSMGSGDIG